MVGSISRDEIYNLRVLTTDSQKSIVTAKIVVPTYMHHVQSRVIFEMPFKDWHDQGNHELPLKSVLVGDCMVGKTCILARHTEDTFKTPNDCTLGKRAALFT